MGSAAIFVCALAALGQFDPADVPAKWSHQHLADRAKFDFDEKQASIWASVQAYEGDCEIHVLYKKGNVDGVKVTFVRDGQEILTFFGHSRTVFAVREKVLYEARFWYNTNGCLVVARDLNNRKVLWATSLTGLGGLWHSAYHNAVNLRIEDSLIRTVGHEMAGDYLELLDRKTGRQVGHRVFRGPGVGPPKRQGESKNQ